MVSHHAGTILTPLWLSGALLFIGLRMAIDPASFLLMLADAAQGIRAFERHLRGHFGYEPSYDAGSSSPGERMAARCVGIVLATFAFVHLAGLAK
jgi:hypothetical protein